LASGYFSLIIWLVSKWKLGIFNQGDDAVFKTTTTALLCFFTLFFSAISHAQNDARKMKIDATKPLKISYESPAWNKNTDKVDTAYVMIRDSKTGQTVRVLIAETGENTGVFNGVYKMNFSGDARYEITPEVYIPPQSMLKDIEYMGTLQKAISDGRLARKPYFFRVQGGIQTMDTFDSKEQAFDAYEKHMVGIGKSTLEARKMAERAFEQKRIAEMAKKAENDRNKLTEVEKAKVKEMQNEMSSLPPEEQARRRKEAEKVANEGLNKFIKNDFKGAEENFAKAYELDPTNSQYFSQYGTALFRNDKYNKAIIMLNIANGPKVNTAERDLYKGLAYMKLEDNENAVKNLSLSQDKKDSNFSPTAALYAGAILYQQEKYEESKERFEWVLDNSQDPAMDKQAEAYIEQIANAMKFRAMKEKPWTLNLTLGLIRDSNILNVSSQDSATNKEGYRWMYGASLERRIIYNEKRQWSGILSYSDMYSTNNNFSAEKSFQDTDPVSVTLYFPYKQSNSFFGKTGQFGFNAGYESISLNADTIGSREVITTSNVFKVDQTLVNSAKWISNYSFEYRIDSSKLTVASGAEASDLNATKMTLGTSQTFFLDDKMTKAAIGDLTYARNNTTGADVRFNRTELGGTYLMPAFWDSSFSTRLSYFLQPYPDSSTSRKDSGYSATLALSKPLPYGFNSSLSATYLNNGSNIETNKYNKYTILALGTWSGNF
jgi:hypothetical protein